MNATALKQQLAGLSGSTGGHKEQADRYRTLLFEQILTSGEPQKSEFLKIFIEASKFLENKYEAETHQAIVLVVNDQVSLVISRQILTEICAQFAKLPDEISMAISHYTLERVQPRVISFEEQVATIRQHLSSIYERQEQWREAANVLGLIPLETGQR